MVQELPRTRFQGTFPESAPTAYPVFYRTYSRKDERVHGERETWQQVCDRTLAGLAELGQLSDAEQQLIARMQRELKALPSGRWLWIGGTEWSKRPENFSGAYNCTSTNVVDWQAFGLMMDLAMMGCGTGAVLEPKYINQLPQIRNRLNVMQQGAIGTTPAAQRRQLTETLISGNQVRILVGDSRQGWVKSYQTLLELASDDHFTDAIDVIVDLSDVRPAGEKLKGFGGMANPVKLPMLYERCANILNKALGRQLNSVECCLLIDEAAACVVAGNIRRSAGIRQFASEDDLATAAKDNLWQQDNQGNWRIDPERDALRMANHTRVFHHKPTLEECTAAVRKQFYSGEGAIQWAGEAERRAGRAGRYGLNPCVTADTWVHTGDGPRQVKDLVGQQHSTYVNGELFSTTPEGFFYSGTKPVLQLTTQAGYALKMTGNHRVLKVTAQTQRAQYTEWVAAETLQPGDLIVLHNHRDFTPWGGDGTFEEGLLLGRLLGEGGLSALQGTDVTDVAVVTNRVNTCLETKSLTASPMVYPLQTAGGYGWAESGACRRQSIIAPDALATLAAKLGLCWDDQVVLDNQVMTNVIEPASYAFYRGFLSGLFEADGTIQRSPTGGITVELYQRDRVILAAVQRMLARLGIISTVDPEGRPTRAQGRSTGNHPTGDTKAVQPVLTIAKDNLTYFHQLIGFQDPGKVEKLTAILGSYRSPSRQERFAVTVAAIAPAGVEAVYDCTVPGPACFDANGLVAHNCGEIIGQDFHCNLAEIHLNRLDPENLQEQDEAFTAGALAVASLLKHTFIEPRYRQSREADPIVGVSFTGLFDFFVQAFGVEWLQWWEAGRPDTMRGLKFKAKEQVYLSRWKQVVHQVVWDYCDRHALQRPNRCTTVQPAGTKSLLTGASPGWHPPKAQRYIRRVTFRKNDPVAMACIDYGYSVVPSQSDKDENGNLLTDPFDPRCTEWLVEMPVEVSWANLPGADDISIEQFSALAQFDFYMQVQTHYTAHNTSATIELRESEIEPLSQRIHDAIQNDEGYISTALLARFDNLQTFPRLPFEPIDQATYELMVEQVKARRSKDNFHAALALYDRGNLVEAGPAGCDSDKCLLPEQKPD